MEGMAALAIRTDRDAAIARMAEANVRDRNTRRELAMERKQDRAVINRLRRNARNGFVEDRAVTGIAMALASVGGAALQARVIDPKITNTYVRRGLLPVGGALIGAGGLAFLNGTAASAVAGAGLGTAVGSIIVQIVKWLAP